MTERVPIPTHMALTTYPFMGDVDRRTDWLVQVRAIVGLVSDTAPARQLLERRVRRELRR